MKECLTKNQSCCSKAGKKTDKIFEDNFGYRPIRARLNLAESDLIVEALNRHFLTHLIALGHKLDD